MTTGNGAPSTDRAPAAEALLRPHPRLGVPVPAYAGRSLPNVMSSVARAVGPELADLLPPLANDLDPFGGRRANGPVVLVVVDGLGYDSLGAAAGARGHPAAREWFADARPITTVFPSSTTVALSSLSTAQSPSRHAVVGHREYLPRFGSVVELLRMSPLGVTHDNTLVGPEWTPASVLGRPTVFRQGVSAVAVSRDRFEGTGFTRMIYDGARYAPYATFADLGLELRRELASDPIPPLLLVYWDELDVGMHLKGPSAELTGFEVERLAGLLAWVAAGLPDSTVRSTTVVLTADHGLVPADPAAQLLVDALPALNGALARPPAGDRRALYFAPRPGADAHVRRALEELLGDRARVFGIEEALDAGLFGPPPFHTELRERIGELIVLPDAPGGMLYRVPGQARGRRVLVGAHGGVDRAELLVPLIAGPLERFRADPARRR